MSFKDVPPHVSQWVECECDKQFCLLCWTACPRCHGVHIVPELTRPRKSKASPESDKIITYDNQTGPCVFCAHGNSGNHKYNESSCLKCDNGVCGGND